MTRETMDAAGKHRRDETGKYIHSWGVMGSIPVEEAKKVKVTAHAMSWIEVAQCSLCNSFSLYGGLPGDHVRLTEKQFDRLFELVPNSHDQDPCRANGIFRARVNS